MMGLSISILSNSPTLPRQTVLTLTCDRCGEAENFGHADGYIAQRAAATAAGWLERQVRTGRMFLGPCCSGKLAA
jgi:hypothetical protein